MGDMADYYLDLGFNDDQLIEEYHAGRISQPEAYEMGLIDEQGYEYQYQRSTKTCRCCGSVNLHWEMVDGKWLLHDNEGVHNCPVNPFQPNFASEVSFR